MQKVQVTEQDICEYLKIMNRYEPWVPLTDKTFNDVYSRLNWLYDNVVSEGLWGEFIEYSDNNKQVIDILCDCTDLLVDLV